MQLRYQSGHIPISIDDSRGALELQVVDYDESLDADDSVEQGR